VLDGETTTIDIIKSSMRVRKWPAANHDPYQLAA